MKYKVLLLIAILILFVLLAVLVSIKVFPQWLTIPGGVLLLFVAILNWFLDLGSKLKDWEEIIVKNNKEGKEESDTSSLHIQITGNVTSSGEQNRTVVSGQYIEQQIVIPSSGKLSGETRNLHTSDDEDIEQVVDEYRQRVINRVKGNWLDHFIDLYIEIPVKLSTKARNHTRDKRYTISQIALEFSVTPIAILGEPGAGKTTLVKKLIVDTSKQAKDVVPVFVEMGMYSNPEDLLNLIDLPIEVTNGKKLLVVFDGFNEIDFNLRHDAARAIVRFVRQHPGNQYFITCRVAEFPPYLRTEFREFYVLRMTQRVVREYLKNVLGREKGELVYRETPLHIRKICENPLLLTMFAFLFTNDDEIGLVPFSKASLYEQFLEQLHIREQSLRYIENPYAIREEFLSYIAYKLDNRTTVFKRKDAEIWMLERYNQKFRDTGINLVLLFHEVLDAPPLRAFLGSDEPNQEISYIHQSFQEYYAAVYLNKQFKAGELTLDTLVDFASSHTEHWWESLILFIGLQEDATPFIRALKQFAEATAKRDGDQRTLTLVARCIREAGYVNAFEVDDVIIRTLLTFKFGKVAFDYDLIYGLKLVEPSRRSKIFPKRLIEDINWWLEKYARVALNRLDKSLSVKQLLEYVKSDDISLSYDALFTLRFHPDRETMVREIVELLYTSTNEFREQLIVTLGYLGQEAEIALDLLIEIIKDYNESKWARAYALNVLGKLGNKKAVRPMVNYMVDHSNPYRDSASWSLQALAKKNLNDNRLHTYLKHVFIDALLSETADTEGRYAKGNIVYTLGELSAVEYTRDIISWLENEHDPYVIEDGVQALGQLGKAESIPIITRHLTNFDPVVRMMAVEALVKVKIASHSNFDILALITPLQTDQFQIVQESVSEAIQEISAGAE